MDFGKALRAMWDDREVRWNGDPPDVRYRTSEDGERMWRVVGGRATLLSFVPTSMVLSLGWHVVEPDGFGDVREAGRADRPEPLSGRRVQGS